MNFIEAIKSGKPFRRKGEKYWFSDGVHGISTVSGSFGRSYLREDILADDWEIQEPTVTITRTQFWAAVRDCLVRAETRDAFGYRSPTGVNAAELAKTLGLD